MSADKPAGAPGGLRIGEAIDNLLVLLLCSLSVAEAAHGHTGLEQGVRRLVMPGKGLIHRLELPQGVLKLALRIVALADPVMRVGGIASLRILLQQALELGDG